MQYIPSVRATITKNIEYLKDVYADNSLNRASKNLVNALRSYYVFLSKASTVNDI